MTLPVICYGTHALVDDKTGRQMVLITAIALKIFIKAMPCYIKSNNIDKNMKIYTFRSDM